MVALAEGVLMWMVYALLPIALRTRRNPLAAPLRRGGIESELVPPTKGGGARMGEFILRSGLYTTQV